MRMHHPPFSSTIGIASSLVLILSWVIPCHPFILLNKSIRSHNIPNTPSSCNTHHQRGNSKCDTTEPIITPTILAASSTPITEEDEPKINNTPPPKSPPKMAIANEQALKDHALSMGVTLSLTTLLSGYRAVARPTHDPEQVLGYCEGFIRPGGKILHVDKLEVWKKALTNAIETNTDTQSPTAIKFQKAAGNVFGISLLLGYLCLLHGQTSGCVTAEFLAIDDEPFQHKRLVRFFRRAGFRVIRYVGEDLKNVPDRMVWGGCGTLMNRDIEGLLGEWACILFRKEKVES